MATNTQFFNRKTTKDNTVDYIAIVNEQLKTDPTSVDPNSPLYSEAIKQYNGELKKGNTVRLDVPRGFCGYINPASGEFRVQPEPDIATVPPGQQIPTTTLAVSPSALSDAQYPVDACLVNGLAGSPAYSQIASRETNTEFGTYTKLSNTSCGTDTQPVESSGVQWDLIDSDYYDDITAQACMTYWQEGGEGYAAAEATATATAKTEADAASLSDEDKWRNFFSGTPFSNI